MFEHLAFRNRRPDCENAMLAFNSEGLSKARLLSVGGGLCVQIMPNALRPGGTYTMSSSWLFRFSLDGRERRMGLGPLDRVHVDKAHIKALARQELVDQNIDPLEQEQEKRHKRKHARQVRQTAKTFQQCAEEYIAEKSHLGPFL